MTPLVVIRTEGLDMFHPLLREAHPTTALAVLFATVLAIAGCGNGDPLPEPPRPALMVQPEAAQAAFSSFAGEVRARHETELGFRIAGKLARRLVEVGETVEKDQPLAELDPGDVRLQVSAVDAQFSAARADADLAAAERDRHAALLQRQLISQSLFDTFDNAARAADARVRQAQAQLDVARNQAGYAVLRAPAAGVITRRLAEAGQVVNAGQPVYVLAESGEREVEISLPERDLAGFSVGQPVRVELWSDAARPLRGSIREISPAADAASRTYAARISLPDEAGRAELGQSARVFVGNGGADALALPLAAVSSEQDEPWVLVLDPATSRVVRRTVEVAEWGEAVARIRSGMEPSDWVVAGGVHLLQDGQQVRAVDRDNRPIQTAGGN
jgi:multidrug efflux system membrane fusion protein